MRLKTTKQKLEQFFNRCEENKRLNKFLGIVLCIAVVYLVVVYGIQLTFLIYNSLI